MTREEFISKLNENIKNIPDHNDIISYYFELISDKMESGMSEEEAVASLGDMDTIIKNIIDDKEEDIEFKEEAIKDHLEDKKSKAENNTTTESHELSGGRKFVYVLWSIATVLFCIAAMFIYVFSFIMIGVSVGLLGVGIYQMTGLLSYGFLIFGCGLFILGASLVGIYYSNYLRKFMFGNRIRWNEIIRTKLVGE